MSLNRYTIAIRPAIAIHSEIRASHRCDFAGAFLWPLGMLFGRDRVLPGDRSRDL
jgi:hypothetical protein